MHLRFIIIPSCLILVGCAQQGTKSATKQVSLPELEKETAHLNFFSYTGNDQEFHYFKTSSGSYKVKRSEWSIPLNLPPMPQGTELFVTVKDGKVTIPDPKLMQDLFKTK